MVWQQWTYLIFAIVGTALSATQVGKPRRPLVPTVFAMMIIFQAMLVWLVVSI